MENENKRIIEVSGVKLEVDMRYAVAVENYKIGSTVKVLLKEYSTYKSFLGVIAGFDSFKNLPTIIVAYVDAQYGSADIKFVYINAESKDVELCMAHDFDIPYTKQDVISQMDAKIEKNKEEIKVIETKKNFFISRFGKIFNFVE